MPLIFDLQPSKSIPKISERNKNNTPLQFKFDSPISSAVTYIEENHNQTPEFTNDKLAIEMQNSTVKNPNEHNEFQSLEIKKYINNNFQIGGQSCLNNDKDKPSLQFSILAS